MVELRPPEEDRSLSEAGRELGLIGVCVSLYQWGQAGLKVRMPRV
jgi:hypothetical protein